MISWLNWQLGQPFYLNYAAPTRLISRKMLNYQICHFIAKDVFVVEQGVHWVEDERVEHYSSIFAGNYLKQDVDIRLSKRGRGHITSLDTEITANYEGRGGGIN